MQDKSLPIEKRANAARKILYGPDSNMSIDELHIDEVSATTIKTQSSAAPLESWWAGARRLCWSCKGYTMYSRRRKTVDR